MVHFITAAETLPLRSSQLRNGQPAANCYLDRDHEPTTFHMGLRGADGSILSVLTCQIEALEGYTGIGYRLRGMATHPQHQGKGIGSQLLGKAIAHLTHAIQAGYIWCHARRAAYGFYQRAGFEFISEEFEILKIGPHRVMYRSLTH